ncbi:MAG: hypothetical protein HQM10_09410 [Candidatus Riflebacteria bacterium]|nr:hypothetical protein [Candidatus Riflebacteria bacterium]
MWINVNVKHLVISFAVICCFLISNSLSAERKSPFDDLKVFPEATGSHYIFSPASTPIMPATNSPLLPIIIENSDALPPLPGIYGQSKVPRNKNFILPEKEGSNSLQSISLGKSSITIAARRTLNLVNLPVFALYSHGTVNISSEVVWSIKTGLGIVSGTRYIAPLNLGNAVLTCSFTDRGITKNTELYLTIVSPESLRAVLQKQQKDAEPKSALLNFLEIFKFPGFNWIYSTAEFLENVYKKLNKTYTGVPEGSFSTDWAINLRALVIIVDPVLQTKGNKRLHEYFYFNDPQKLANEFISDIKESTNGQVEFEIAEILHDDTWQPYTDKPALTEDQFVQYWEGKKIQIGDKTFERKTNPLGLKNYDYVAMLNKHNVKSRVESGDVDEVWLFSYPESGTSETCMAGTGAVWCNGAVIENFKCSKSFVVYGFNYERGVDCMLEDLGHRAESMLRNAYGSWKPDDKHLWARFSRYEKRNPGAAACGNVHFAPNSEIDYDWGNTRLVESDCDDWLTNFPHLKGTKRKVSCDEWGGVRDLKSKFTYDNIATSMRNHHIWWFKRFPHHEGTMDGNLINWWKYIFDWNLYRP